MSNVAFASCVSGGISTIPTDTESEVILQKGSKGILPCREEGNLTINNVAWSKGSFDSLPLMEAGYYKDAWEKGGLGYDRGTHDVMKNFSLVIKHVEINDDELFFCTSHILQPRTFLISQVNVSVFGKLYMSL